MGKIMAIKKITEGTAIPISLVISISTAVYFLSGSIQKINFLEVRADSVKQRVIKIEESQANFQKDATDRLARIETKMDLLLRTK